MSKKPDNHVSNVVLGALGTPWGKTDVTHHSGGGFTAHHYVGPFSNWPQYHGHTWTTGDKDGKINSGTVHGLMQRPWNDKKK